ncbi:hypothetical protein KPH14_012688 [Odynerus spinipes]|uniref:Uncharacterized protein n=1 Tax=Odynerus spinipes TaxID=1348599 RepID=A0AAD9VIW0_9HYME|nr:hypothetical protein KPH14_012688 [Odynerus spinipes]
MTGSANRQPEEARRGGQWVGCVTPPVAELKEISSETFSALPRKKKIKTNAIKTPTPVVPSCEAITEIESEIKINPKKHPLDFLQLTNFLEKTQGKQPLQDIASEFLLTPSELENMLRRLYPKLTGRGMKTKFTKTIKKLKLITDDKLELSDDDNNDPCSGTYSDVSSMELEQGSKYAPTTMES